MDRKRKSSLIIGVSCLALMILSNGCGAGKDKGKDMQKPAEVSNQVKENTLTTVRLSAEAENRLGIETGTAEIRNLPGTLTLGGEIMVPPGQEVKVTAPVSGMVSRTAKGYFPVAGSPIQRTQEAMRIVVIPPEMDILSAAEDVKVKQMEFEVALSELNRARTLLENKAISDKVFESIQADHARAKASLDAARGRLNLYQGKDIDSAASLLSTFTVESPVTGVLQNIGVTPGQIVPSSALLFEVSPLNVFWIRVPVYSGDLAAIETGQQATVSTMGNRAAPGLLLADPIRGPLISHATSASSYLYYEIDNCDGILRSGQKVSVTLNLKSPEQSLAVPYSSVIYDIQGGTWVYVKQEPFVYVRRRVDLDHVADSLAVVTRGISPGDEIVYAGAAELFGTEFGIGK